jgi:hypothetical protein
MLDLFQTTLKERLPMALPAWLRGWFPRHGETTLRGTPQPPLGLAEFHLYDCEVPRKASGGSGSPPRRLAERDPQGEVRSWLEAIAHLAADPTGAGPS